MKYITNKQEGAERHVAMADAKAASPVHNRRNTETDRYRLDYESPTVIFPLTNKIRAIRGTATHQDWRSRTPTSV